MDRLIICCIFLVVTSGIKGQNTFDSFDRLVAEGEIPTEFTDLFTDKYHAAADAISEKLSKKERHLIRDFHMGYQFMFDELFTSGVIIYGDPITKYLQSVVDHLLKDQSVEKHIRVYLARSTDFNGFCSDDGILVINLGLMARVENEAQLALVLAHEIIHAEEDHFFKHHMEKLKIKADGDYFKGGQRDVMLQQLSSHKKSLEFEADQLGYLNFFLPAGYDAREAVNITDVMLHSYLPLENKPFPKNYFDTDSFQLFSGDIPNRVSPIQAIADYDDDKMLHPNLKSRRDTFYHLVQQEEAPFGKRFIVSEEEFFESRNLARFEMTNIYLKQRSYPEAIYHCFLLLEEFPNNPFLRKSMGTALLNMAIYKNNHDYGFIGKRENIEGYLQQIYRLIETIDPLELSILATHYNYENHKRYPNDSIAKTLFTRSLEELIHFHEIEPNFFIGPGIEPHDLISFEEDIEDHAELNEKEKKLAIKKKKVQVAMRNAFYLSLQDSIFRHFFDRELNVLQEKRNDVNYVSKKCQREIADAINQKIYKRKFSEPETTIDNVIIFSPAYIKLNRDLSPPLHFELTESAQGKYRNNLLTLARRAGLKAEILDFKSLNPYDTDKFNDIIFLKDWMDEFWEHPNTDNKISSSRHSSEFIKKYGTRYLIHTGYVNISGTPDYRPGAIFVPILSWLAPPLFIPSSLYFFGNARGKTFAYTYLIDIQSETVLFYDFLEMDGKDTDDIIRSRTYDYMLKIKDLNR